MELYIDDATKDEERVLIDPQIYYYYFFFISIIYICITWQVRRDPHLVAADKQHYASDGEEGGENERTDGENEGIF